MLILELEGPYSVSMDGKSTDFDGFSANDNFTSLFDSGSLKAGQHTVVITNNLNDTNRPYLDVDYVTHFPWLSEVYGSQVSDYMVNGFVSSRRKYYAGRHDVAVFVHTTRHLEDRSSQRIVRFPKQQWPVRAPSYIRYLFALNIRSVTQEKGASGILSFSVRLQTRCVYHWD
jgi:hypothetical protein